MWRIYTEAGASGHFLSVCLRIIPPLQNAKSVAWRRGKESRQAEGWREGWRENVRFYVTSATSLLASQSLSNWGHRKKKPKTDLCKKSVPCTPGHVSGTANVKPPHQPTRHGTGDFSGLVHFIHSRSENLPALISIHFFFRILQGNEKTLAFFFFFFSSLLLACAHVYMKREAPSKRLLPCSQAAGRLLETGNCSLASHQTALSFRLSRVKSVLMKIARVVVRLLHFFTLVAG